MVRARADVGKRLSFLPVWTGAGGNAFHPIGDGDAFQATLAGFVFRRGGPARRATDAWVRVLPPCSRRLGKLEDPPTTTRLEQSLTDMTGEYLEAKGVVDPDTNDFCEKLAIEACLHQPWALPGLARRKFLLSAKGPVSIGYDEPRLQEKLNIGFNRKNMLGVLAKGLTGRELSDTPAVEAFVKDHYHPMPWFAFLDESWQRLTLANDNDITSKAMQIPNLPAFFVLALLGAGVFLASPGPLQRFHIAWILSLSGLWFAVELTGVVNPRYRFAFEPFCLIYATLGFLAAGVNAAAAARHFFAPAERTQVTRMGEPTRPRKTRDRRPATVPGSDCH